MISSILFNVFSCMTNAEKYEIVLFLCRGLCMGRGIERNRNSSNRMHRRSLQKRSYVPLVKGWGRPFVCLATYAYSISFMCTVCKFYALSAFAFKFLWFRNILCIHRYIFYKHNCLYLDGIVDDKRISCSI